MANAYGSGVWTIDTAISAASLLGAIGNNRVKVVSLAWNAGNSGLSCAVSDGTTTIWSAASTANEQNFIHDFDDGTWIDSLGIPTLGGGTLFITVG